MIKLMTLHRFTIALAVVAASFVGFIAHGFLLLNEELLAVACAGAVLLFALIAVNASNQNEDKAVDNDRGYGNGLDDTDYEHPIDDDPYPRSHIWL